MRIAKLHIGILFVCGLLLFQWTAPRPALSDNDTYDPKKHHFEVYTGYSKFKQDINWGGAKLEDIYKETGGDISYYTLGIAGDVVIFENMMGEIDNIPNVVRASAELIGGDNSTLNYLFGYKITFEYGWLFRLKRNIHLLPYLGFSYSHMSSNRSTAGTGLYAKTSENEAIIFRNQNINMNHTITLFLLGLKSDYYLDTNNHITFKGGVLFPEEIRTDIPNLKELPDNSFFYWEYEPLKPAFFAELGYTYKAYSLDVFYNQLKTKNENTTVSNDVEDETYGVRFSVDVW